jgi:hypothetical protein
MDRRDDGEDDDQEVERRSSHEGNHGIDRRGEEEENDGNDYVYWDQWDLDAADN